MSETSAGKPQPEAIPLNMYVHLLSLHFCPCCWGTRKREGSAPKARVCISGGAQKVLAAVCEEFLKGNGKQKSRSCRAQEFPRSRGPMKKGGMRMKGLNESKVVFGELEAQSTWVDARSRGTCWWTADEERCGIAELGCLRSGGNEEGASLSRTAESRRGGWQRAKRDSRRGKAVPYGVAGLRSEKSA